MTLKTSIHTSDRFALAGKTVELNGFDGLVFANQRWTESKTTWSGRGSVNRETGELRLPDLVSSTTEQQEFWLRLDSGLDVQCRYTGRIIPVTQGQRVTVIAMSIGASAANMALVNHATGNWHPLIELDRGVHAWLTSRPSWLGTFFIAAFGWLLIGVAATFCGTVGAPTIKTFINGPTAQAFFAFLIAILPSAPGTHDRGETIVMVVALAGLVLLAAPLLYALGRHCRRYIRFRRVVGILEIRINQLAQRASIKKGNS